MPSELQSVSAEQSNPVSREKPDWAGGDWLSRMVNLLIKTKPIYAVMKQQARQVLIKTAEKNGIPWRDNTQALLNSGVKNKLQNFTNPAVTYPDYYNVPFHAYDAGNLCWEAACEAQSATYSMALRVWKNESLTADEAQARLRSTFHQALIQQGITQAENILDVGCSIGISTQTIHDFYLKQSLSQSPSRSPRTIGFDLSPYMLAIAAHQDPTGLISQWVHGRAEATEFESETFDLITLQFVLHELPRSATLEIFKEMHRLLKPGSHIAIVDNNPKSTVIQNLPPVLFTLMKSTEPWTDDYYTFDVEAALLESGFSAVTTVESDPRHRTLNAKKS
jgi:ubiquinone/menaquinone biosynthesis C-methylase UbiE